MSNYPHRILRIKHEGMKIFKKEKLINIHYSSSFHPLGGNSFWNGNKCYSLLHLKACMHDMRKGNKAPRMDQSSSASALRPVILRSGQL